MNETKEHILKSSLVLFLQNSYRDVTMSAIVEKTGLSKGAFYHHFPSKEALFKEIVHHFFSFGNYNYSEMGQTSFRSFYREYAHQNAASMNELMNFVGESPEGANPYNFFFILFEAVRRFPEFLEIELEMHKRDVGEWAKVIANAKKQGEIQSKMGNAEIAELFLYCTDGIALRSISIKQADFMANEIVKVFDNLYETIKI
jgi:TetR/AcrR family transcriptional regulator, transcriptional repressor for nem operon